MLHMVQCIFKIMTSTSNEQPSVAFFRGLYPNLVRDNVKKNMETLAAVGVENYVVQGDEAEFQSPKFIPLNLFEVKFTLL